ncbi:hypothetical protein OESDEN_24606, partial [Oesophagostomum dentatum]
WYYCERHPRGAILFRSAPKFESSKFSQILSLTGLFRMKRMVHPPRNLEDVGFFLPDGEVELDVEEVEVDITEEEEDNNEREEQVEDNAPNQTDEDVRVKEEAPEQKERKPTYYELLQKRMREREAQSTESQTCEKKPRID